MSFEERHIERYADVMMWGLKKARSQEYQEGDIVRIVVQSINSVILAEKLFSRVVEAGFNPVIDFYGTPTMEKNFYTFANDEQLKFIGSWERSLFRKINGNIFIWSPESLTHLSSIDQEKIAKETLARKSLKDILWKRTEIGECAWTLCLWPTPALEEAANLTHDEYCNQVIKACYLNSTDPTATWEIFYNDAIKIRDWLTRLNTKYFHIESLNTNLRIPAGEERQWLSCDGMNIPSFEFFISPDWREVEGYYFSDIPSYKLGNRIEGVKLIFEDGVVKTAIVDEGQEFVDKFLDTDKGAKSIGEFALIDKRWSKIDKFMANVLYDENYGGPNGSSHIALGAAYAESYTGDQNKLTKSKKKKLGFNDSAIHWDLVNSEDKVVTSVAPDGTRTVIYEKGKFNNPE